MFDREIPTGSRTTTTSRADGVEILTPDPASSGGARWNIVAAYGAAERGQVPDVSG